MKTEFENIIPDPRNSFRVLHHQVQSDAFQWHYHYHPELELVCVLGGTGRRHVGNHLSNYQDGDLVFIGSNVPHSGFGYGAVGIHEAVIIQFREDFLGNALSSSTEFEEIRQLFEIAKQGIAFHGKTRSLLTDKIENMYRLPYFERLLLLLDILQHLAISQEYTLLNPAEEVYSFNKKDEQRLRKIYDYVEINYPKTITIEEISEIANLSVPAFCNYFKKNMNQTFIDFLNEFRINKACKLMSEKDNLSDICYTTGFSSLSYFSKVFKQVKGNNPREYRKMLKENQI